MAGCGECVLRIEWNVGLLVNGTFLDINGETSQFMRLLSKKLWCEEGKSWIRQRNGFRRKRFKPLLVLTFWDILVVYSSL